MKKIVLGAALAVLSLAGAWSPAAAFQQLNPPGVAEQTLYYDRLGNYVGEYRVYCDGHDSFWGRVDEVSYIYDYSC